MSEQTITGSEGRSRALGLGELLAGRRTCIVAGSGGVGKTTVAAAIGAAMASCGLKVAVLTIDPARRLADALGIAEPASAEHRVDPRLLEQAGLGGGELWAMMLDSKATFDAVIDRHAPDEAARERILSNRIYQRLSSALAGSQEYMAMERLYELDASGRYDLLVLDTPPSRHAVDFLEAPRRLSELIEGRAIRAFARPTGAASRLVGRSARTLFPILRRITGIDLLRDLAEFFDAFSGMVDGFRDRARRVESLLADPSTGFLVVAAPEPEPVVEALEFGRRLERAGLPLLGAIVNRVQVEALTEVDELALAASLSGTDRAESLGERLAESVRELRVLAERDREMCSRLERGFASAPLIVIPQLSAGAHDLAGLAGVAAHLVEPAGFQASSGERRA